METATAEEQKLVDQGQQATMENVQHPMSADAGQHPHSAMSDSDADTPNNDIGDPAAAGSDIGDPQTEPEQKQHA